LVYYYRFAPNRDPIIKRPTELQNMSLTKYLIEKKDWDSNSQYLIKFGEQRQACYWIKGPKDIELDYLVSYPPNLKEYVPPETECQKMDSFKTEAVHANQQNIQLNKFLIYALFLFIILIL
jgi:hypothetical protein